MPPTPPTTVPGFSDSDVSAVPLSFAIPSVDSSTDEQTGGAPSQFLSPHWYSAQSSPRACSTRTLNDNGDNGPVLGLTLRPPSRLSALSSRSSLGLPLERSSDESDRSRGIQSSSASTLATAEVTPSLWRQSVLSFSHVAEPGGEAPIRIDLQPIKAKSVARYNRGVIVKRREHTDPITPMQRDFSFDGPMPDGWEICIQPEGALYFYHKNKRVVTDSNMTDPHTSGIILDCIIHVESALKRNGIEMPEDCEIALELLPQEDGSDSSKCGYYFVDNQTRSLFWFDTYDAVSLLEEVEGEICLRHMKLELESQYWACIMYPIEGSRFHCEMYPNHREVESELIQEVQGILMHATVDAMTSSSSTTPYRHDVSEKMLGIVSKAKEIGNVNGYSACVISRLMGTFAHTRFLHYYGLPSARLSRSQSVYGIPTNQRSWLICIVSPLLFNSPELYRKLLEEIWVDRQINYQSWGLLLSKLQGEWEHVSITSTVMLTVNVGFLAIQSVDRAIDVRSAAQAASYLGAVLSVGSIVMGLILTKGHRTIVHDDAEVAQMYLWSKYHETWGMEILAIMYGLPHALLMWSMTAFFTALSLQYFQLNPNMEATSISMRVTFGLIWLVILVLIIWFLLSDWLGRRKSFWVGLTEYTDSLGWRLANVLESVKKPNWLCIRRPAKGEGQGGREMGDVTSDSAA
ncbi:hypothetical protein NEOLEDRAFT_1178985 [Neolentinus lepideus HHB14362 ss-1]|uniref:WW domain-containing protein n=1 Tax=Neolentinus lepideus HHB14362 ss-1 TaxID=1314782 RepID=A0A165SB79_9AGAM|nr:hypothetical protein NEOLEDRAFT_1178985 [Neolentinus lepideus HHB14362 ss-1]